MVFLSGTTGKVVGCNDPLGRDRLAGLERLEFANGMELRIVDRAGAPCLTLSGLVAVYQHPLGAGFPGEAARGKQAEQRWHRCKVMMTVYLQLKVCSLDESLSPHRGRSDDKSEQNQHTKKRKAYFYTSR